VASSLRRRGWAGLLLLAALAGTACQSPSPSGETEAAGDAQVITVEAHEYRYSPRTIEFEPGKPVTLTLRNEGLVDHTFTTEDPATDVVVPARQSRTVTVSLGRAVAYFCRFHQANGMQGALCARGKPCTSPLLP